MKKIVLSVFFLVSTAVCAEHACEIVFREFRAERATENQLQHCYGRLGKPQSVQDAEAYLDNMKIYEGKLKEKEVEILQAMSSERAGVIVQKLGFNGIVKRNKEALALPMAMAAKVIFHKRKSDVEHEMTPDRACRELGFDKSIKEPKVKTLYEYSELTREYKKKKAEVPQYISVYCEGGFFKKKGIGTVDMKSHSGEVCGVDLNESEVSFDVYTELTCQRNKKEGETIQDFIVDPNAIRDAAEDALKNERPKLSKEAARVLDIERRTSERKAGEKIEDDEEKAKPGDGAKFYDFGGFSK